MGKRTVFKKYIIKKCIFCGVDILKRSNESINTYYKRKFCKLSCQHQWNAKNKSSDVKCDFCGILLRRRNSGIGVHNFCSERCQYKYYSQTHTKIASCNWCGKSFTKKLSDRKTKRVFCTRKCMGEWQSKYVIGELSPSWNGGSSSLNRRIRSLVKYVTWMKRVYNRDNYTCQVCGDAVGGNLNVHHIKSLSKIIKDCGIKCIADAIICSELWDIENGVTVCKKCHAIKHRRK